MKRAFVTLDRLKAIILTYSLPQASTIHRPGKTIINSPTCINKESILTAAGFEVPQFERAVMAAGDDLAGFAQKFRSEHFAPVAGQRVLKTKQAGC